MITKEEIQELLHSTETFRVERTISTSDMDKFQEAICAFANDLPNSRKKGYLILGAYDNGNLSGLKVSPSDLPPVRYRGRCFIRIGPRRDIATEVEERILAERRSSFMPTFDTMPCFRATMDDIDTELVRTKYLENLIGKEIIESDSRSIEEQMAAVGLYDMGHQKPTNAAVVLFGRKPRRLFPGLYVQYVRFRGQTITDPVENEMQLEGNYCDLLPRLETLLEMSVIRKRPVFVSILREEMVSNYPYQAIRELLLNACMHRDTQSNTPLRFYEFDDHIEIMNAGGLYGNARPENFPYVNDYRNPLIASAMKTLGYVNMFNRGIRQVPGLSQALSQVLSQACPRLEADYYQNAIIVLRTVSNEPQSLKMLKEATGEKNRSRMKNNVLKHLIESGVIAPTIADIPSSPKQKYRLTEKGKKLL